MDMQLNDNVFDQLTADRDHTRQTAGLAAMIAHSSEQSFGLGWPGHCQAENGERTKTPLSTHLSIDLAVDSAATAHGRLRSSSYARPRRRPVNIRAAKKPSSPAPGGVAEHTSIEIAYRVALSLMEREQITLARKALDCFSCRAGMRSDRHQTAQYAGGTRNKNEPEARYRQDIRLSMDTRSRSGLPRSMGCVGQRGTTRRPQRHSANYWIVLSRYA